MPRLGVLGRGLHRMRTLLRRVHWIDRRCLHEDRATGWPLSTATEMPALSPQISLRALLKS